MRTLIFPAGKTQKNLHRLTKWAGFSHNFAGGLHSANHWGNKLSMPNGDMVVQLWPQATIEG